jgi:PadR family transcriptional regulator PadR
LLALIAEEPSYGYEMVDKLQARGLELISEGSIYPTLSRLQKAGLIIGYFVEIDGRGPPRKYYRIADSGRERLNEWTREWERLSSGVTTVLLESGAIVASTSGDHIELPIEGEQHGF